MDCITVEDVREEMLDRQADDHLVLADLAFTDADIVWAMKHCARKFNSLKPYVCVVTYDQLSAETTMFFDGIAWALLRRWRRNAAMNDLDFASGGVTAKVQGSLVENLTRMVDELEEQFVSAATDFKVIANLDGAYGQIG